MTAIWTAAGRNLVAGAVQSTSNMCAMSYIAISTGCGTLATALSLGTSYTSLTLNANVPVSLAAGQTLVLTDGTNTQTVVTSGSVTGGTTTAIPVVAFVASANFAINVTGVAPQPQASDISLYNETLRLAAFPGGAGAAPGESLTQGYFDGTQASGIYVLVGYFGGASATATLGSGTLMAADIQYWNHTINIDTMSYVADSTV